MHKKLICLIFLFCMCCFRTMGMETSPDDVISQLGVQEDSIEAQNVKLCAFLSKHAEDLAECILTQRKKLEKNAEDLCQQLKEGKVDIETERKEYCDFTPVANQSEEGVIKEFIDKKIGTEIGKILLDKINEIKDLSSNVELTALVEYAQNVMQVNIKVSLVKNDIKVSLAANKQHIMQYFSTPWQKIKEHVEQEKSCDKLKNALKSDGCFIARKTAIENSLSQSDWSNLLAVDLCPHLLRFAAVRQLGGNSTDLEKYMKTDEFFSDLKTQLTDKSFKKAFQCECLKHDLKIDEKQVDNVAELCKLVL